MASKKRATRFNGIVSKAIQTSSASRRFGADDDPEKEDIRDLIGGGSEQDLDELIEQQDQERRESFEDEESLLHARLIAQLTPEQANEAIRIIRNKRRKERLTRLENTVLKSKSVQSGAPERSPDAEEFSEYVTEDAEAKAARHRLSEAFNWQATAPGLVGGPTRPEQPLEHNITTSYTEQRSGRPEFLSKAEYDELFGSSKVQLSPAQEKRVAELLEKKRNLAALESRMARRIQGQDSALDRRIRARRAAGAAPGQPPLPGVEEPLPHKINASLGVSDLVEARKRVQEEKKQLEQQLRDISARTGTRLVRNERGEVVRTEKIKPEEAEARARRAVDEAFKEIPDPLAPIPSKKGGRQPSTQTIHPESIKIRQRPGERPQRVVDKELIDEFIHESKQSFVAPTQDMRAEAAERAHRLHTRMSQAIQKEVSDRKEERDIQDAVRKVSPQYSYTKRAQIEQGLQTQGLRPASDQEMYKLAARESVENASREARARREKERSGVVYTSEFGRALARASGRPIPQPKDPRSFVDPRINALTTEDLYKAYGHESTTVAKRLAWEVEKQKARVEGRPVLRPHEIEDLKTKLRKEETPLEEKRHITYTLHNAFTDEPPHPIKALKTQGRFIASQTHSRARGFIQGTELVGYDTKGRPVSLPGKGARTVIGTNPKVRIGSAPNIAYKYQIRNPKMNVDEAIQVRSSMDTALADKQEAQDLLTKLKNYKTSGSLSGALGEGRQRQETIAQKQRELDAINERIGVLKTRLDKFEKPREEIVLPTDLSRRFEEGQRNRYGELIDEAHDELIAAPEIIHQYQKEKLRFRAGQRVPTAGKTPTPKGIDEIKYVPVPGGRGQTSTISDPTGSRVMIPMIETPGGHWEEISREDYNDALAERSRWERSRSAGRENYPTPPGWPSSPPPPPRVEERPRPRKIQYTYMDPKHLELPPNQRDISTVRVPKIGPFGERVIPVQYGQDETSRWDLFPGRLLRVHGEQQRLQAARQVSRGELPEAQQQQVLEQHGIRSKEEAHILASAASAAGFYSVRNRFAHGTVPYRIEKYAEKHGGDLGLSINKAYITPGLEKTANFKEGLKHPLVGMTSGLSGIETTRLRNRTFLVSHQTRARNILRAQSEKAERVLQTQEFVRAHQQDRGPVGAYTRWKLSALTRSPDYKFVNNRGILPQAIETAREAQNQGIVRYIKPNTEEEIPVHISPELRLEAEARLERLRHIERRLNNLGPIDEHLRPRPSFINRATMRPGMERNILIGGAVVGTAAGAAYLYHRHQENKKPEDQRVSFYNRALPKAFETPKMFPHGSVSRTIRFGDEPVAREIGLVGKQLPVAFHVGFHSKSVKLRPSDRGYSAHAPIVGRPSFKGTPGGSKTKGLSYYPTNQKGQGDIGRRGNIRRRTHELTIAGRKVPGALNIGQYQNIQLSRTNPNALSASQREDIIWAHEGTDQEDHVKAFYRGAGGRVAEDLLDTWNNPEEMARIRRQKVQKSRSGRQYQRRAVRELQRVYSSTPR